MFGSALFTTSLWPALRILDNRTWASSTGLGAGLVRLGREEGKARKSRESTTRIAILFPYSVLLILQPLALLLLCVHDAAYPLHGLELMLVSSSSDLRLYGCRRVFCPLASNQNVSDVITLLVWHLCCTGAQLVLEEQCCHL